MDQLTSQFFEFVQTPVGLGVAAVAVIIVLLILRKLLSVIFLIAGLGVLGWAGLRYTDVIEIRPPAEPTFAAARSAPGGGFTAEAASAPLTRSLSGGGSAADAEAAATRTLPLNYNRPTQMGLERATAISLVVDATGEDQGAALLEGFVGDIISGQAALTAHVSASLTGSGFDVEMISPRLQTLSEETPNRWTWEVTPKAEGEQILTLEIFAHQGAAGPAQPVAAYTDRITVHVSRVGLILALANRADPVIGVVAGTVSLSLALFGFIRRRRK